MKDNKENLIHEEILNYLNELLELDPKNISKIFLNNIKVNDSIANHEHAIVNMDNEMGPLGIINGYLSSKGEPLICSEVSIEHNEIIGFQISPLGDKKEVDYNECKFKKDNNWMEGRFRYPRYKCKVQKIFKKNSFSKHIDYKDCSSVNANNNCKNFKPKLSVIIRDFFKKR